MKQISKIIKSQQSIANKVYSIIGITIGLSCILVAIKLQLDLNTFQNKYASSGENEAYIEVNKEVGIFNTITSTKTEFSEKEIQNILSDDKILDVGGFQSNTFKITASSSHLGFRTELFFTSIDDKFIDCSTSEFEWKEGDNEIPIIIANSYFNQYNHSFAQGQNLPQIPKEAIKSFSMDITMRGNGKTKKMTGKIVGFSDRINSVIVPQNFLTWANKSFGETSDKYSKLIVKLKDKNDPELEKWFNQKGLVINKELLGGQSVNRLFNLVSGITIGFGILVLSLALIVISLSLKLSISKSIEDLRLLHLLGYSKKTISKQYFFNFLLYFGISITLTVFTVILSTGKINKWYPIIGLEIYDFQVAKQTAIAFTMAASISSIIWLSISRAVKSL